MEPNKRQVFHCLPINDLREHEESADCWCRPRVEEDGCAVIHNALDGRELIERGERLIQ